MYRPNLIRLVLICGLVLAVLLLIRQHGAAGQRWTADPGGEPSAGRRLAAAWCAECHSLGPGASGEGKVGPAFAAIAKMPSTTALSLRVFLRSSHKAMPNLMIERQDADDIVAYILSLKPH
jgi:mono/diheme cytochrome c family protein